MRKLLAIITTLAMVLSLSVPAFAVTIDSTEEGRNTATKTVTANYAQSYDVTIADTENGTVTASHTTAKEGEEITLTITPAENYELDTLTVTYGENQSVTVTENKFTMPAADVTVTATFKEEQVVVTNATITGVTIGGVDTNDEDAYVIHPTSTVTITVSGMDFGKLSDINKVSINGTVEELTAENGWTVDTANGTATKTYAGTTFANGLALKYTNDGGDTWIDVNIPYVYEIPEVVSVDIDWGDMKFTYSDDTSAWAADAEDGDKVTVTNNGTVAVGASVAYTPADGYADITGSFDPASANLDAEGGQEVFTLTLNGAPTGDLKDVAIGNVTVTIGEPIESVSLNLSFTDGTREGHKWHIVRFYDGENNLISETEQSTDMTESVDVPLNAKTFDINYHTKRLDALMDGAERETSKYDVPNVNSDVAVTFGTTIGTTNTTVKITPAQ